MQPLLLHGVGGDVMDQTASKAWLELDVFFFSLEILSTAQPPEPPSGFIIQSLRIRDPVEQNTGVFPLPPNPF